MTTHWLASIPFQNAVKCNLWKRMDESMPSSKSVEKLEQRALDSKEKCLTDKHVEDKRILEEYMLDTSLENSSLNEELLECLESSVKGSMVPIPQEIDHSEIDIKKCSADIAEEITEQFKSPVKAVVHKSGLSQSKSPGLCNLAVQTQTSSNAAANTSIDSVVDAAELDNLLDGVEWSPMITCPDNLHSSR